MSLNPEKIKESLKPLLTKDQSISLQITLKNFDPKKDSRFDINHILPHKKRFTERILILSDKSLTSIIENKYPKFTKDLLFSNYDGVSFLTLDEVKDNKRLKKKLTSWHHAIVTVPNFNKFYEMRIAAGKNTPLFTIRNNNEIETFVNELKQTVKIKMRKGMNIDFCVGNSKLSENELSENVVSCVNVLAGALKRGILNLKSVYVKGTVGKPVQII